MKHAYKYLGFVCITRSMHVALFDKLLTSPAVCICCASCNYVILQYCTYLQYFLLYCVDSENGILRLSFKLNTEMHRARCTYCIQYMHRNGVEDCSTHPEYVHHSVMHQLCSNFLNAVIYMGISLSQASNFFNCHYSFIVGNVPLARAGLSQSPT